MNPTASVSLKFFVAGLAFLGLFGLLLLLPGEHREASLLTRLIFFVGLIPPPICFGVGLGIAVWRNLKNGAVGAWTNGSALVLHGVLMIVVLQNVLP